MNFTVKTLLAVTLATTAHGIQLTSNSEATATIIRGHESRDEINDLKKELHKVFHDVAQGARLTSTQARDAIINTLSEPQNEAAKKKFTVGDFSEALQALTENPADDKYDDNEFVPVAMAVMNEQVIHVDEPLSLIADVFDHQEKLYEVGFKTLSYDQLSTLFGKLGLSYTAAEIETEAGMHDHADPVPVEDFTDLFFESWKQSEKLDVTDKAAMQEYFLENDENKDGQLTMLEAASLLSKVNIDATINYDQFEDLAENMAEVIGITVPNIEDNTHLENWDNETGRPLPETPAAV